MLNWKSYGDHGRCAQGVTRWVIVTDGAWWHLSADGERRGKFRSRDDAMQHAQDREDGVQISAYDDDPYVSDSYLRYNEPPPIPFADANPDVCSCLNPWSNCPTHG